MAKITFKASKNCLQILWSRSDFLKMSCRHLYWYVLRKIFLRSLRIVSRLSCLEEAVLRYPKIILKRRLIIRYKFHHGSIIQTGITCKKIPYYMRDLACRWCIVKKAKIFWIYVKHFWIFAGMGKCRILIGLCK